MSSRHRSDFFPSAVHCFLPSNGIWAGEAAAAAGASLPPGTGRPHFRSAGSGSEEGIPRRLPLPEGVRAVAPAPVPAAAGAPVGAASGRGRGGLTPGPPPSYRRARGVGEGSLSLMRSWFEPRTFAI